jgi:hypothetical protein
VNAMRSIRSCFGGLTDARCAPVRNLLLAVPLAMLLLALTASSSLADTGSGIGITEITCTHVTFIYEGFPEAEGNTVTETVSRNHEVLLTKTFTFNGSTGTDSIPIPVVPGRSLIDAHAVWKINGFNGGFDHHHNVKCQASYSIQKLQRIKGSGEPFITAPLSAKSNQTAEYEVVLTNVSLLPLKFSNFTDVGCDEGTIGGGPGEAAVEPGESTIFTCTRLLTTVGSYTNEASVTGQQENGPPVTQTSNQVLINVPFDPGFSIEKLQEIAGSEAGYTAAPVVAGAGKTVNYEFIVTNTGNVPLTMSGFSDSKCGAGTISGGPGNTPVAVGESTVYFCTHLLVQKDLKNGPFENQSSVKGTPPANEGKTVDHSSNVVVVLPPGGTGKTEITCKQVVAEYTGFPNLPGNTVIETVTEHHVLIVMKEFVFNGPSGTDVIPLELTPGKHNVDLHATWKTNGASGGFDHHATLHCE